MSVADVSAVVLQLPAKVRRQARRRMNRTEMDARHGWMMSHYREWATSATDGIVYHSASQAAFRKKLEEMMPDEFRALTMERMRTDIAKGRKLIEKRNRVKAWLASLGADLRDIEDAEQALFFVFDKLG